MNEILVKLNGYYHLFLKMLPRLALAFFVLIMGFIVANWLTNMIRERLKNKSKDTLMSGFLSNAIKMALFIVIFLLALNIAGLSGIAGALLATAGASAVELYRGMLCNLPVGYPCSG